MSGTRKSAAERRAKASAENRGGSGAVVPIGRRFQPGQSGNPGGRPKGVASAFRGKVDPERAAEALLDIAENAPRPEHRIAAWRELLDRGYGKAPAFAAIEGTDPLELDVIAQEIQGIADELRARRDERESASG